MKTTVSRCLDLATARSAQRRPRCQADQSEGERQGNEIDKDGFESGSRHCVSVPPGGDGGITERRQLYDIRTQER
jgi:hypothetical protein